MFAVQRLRVRYPAQERWAVDGVDLDFAPGQVTWLTGALGSGTSTLLLALAGLMPRLTGGERTGMVMADGVDVSRANPLSQGIAYLGPSPALQISGVAATVRDEVSVGPINLARPRADILAAATAALDRLHIGHLAGRNPSSLSGGETQRMLLAAQLASAPRAWLLDEPFSALDHASTGHVRQLLRDLARGGATVVVACDDADTMLGAADRMIVMAAGRVVLSGEPEALLGGDEILAAGVGSTDAATLAAAAGLPAPRPINREALLARLPERVPAIHSAQPDRPLPAESLVGMTDVRFSYQENIEVLGGVTFAVAAGEAVGLFGANGAGKSTLLRLAMALERPSAGAVMTLGTSTRGRFPEDLAPRVGFLFQQPERQLFAASVRAECALAPRLAGWNAARTAQAVDAVLKELGLTDTANEHPYDLPLPRRRLVALAAILTADPELILLDEPTAALDFASRERVVAVVQERIRRGKGVLAITHDAAFAHEALTRGLLLQHGRMVHDGPVRDVIDDDRMRRPSALAAALVLGLSPGEDRRGDVARAMRRGL